MKIAGGEGKRVLGKRGEEEAAEGGKGKNLVNFAFTSSFCLLPCLLRLYDQDCVWCEVKE